MFPLIGSLLAPVLGALVGGGMSMMGAQQQNSANAESVQNQMNFQERMSNTSYQRGRQDMEAAGYNPMLAYSQGGASSAAGASFNSVNVGDAAVSGAQSGTQSAIASKMMKENIDNIQADTKAKGANEKAAMASAVASMANAQLANNNSATVAAMRPYSVAINRDNSTVALNEAFKSNMEREYLQSIAGRAARMGSFAGQDTAKITSALKGWLINR